MVAQGKGDSPLCINISTKRKFKVSVVKKEFENFTKDAWGRSRGLQKVVLGLFALLLGGPEVKMMSRSWVVFAYVVRFPG